MRPPDERIGRKLANGRFEVVDWIGTSEWMGVAIAVDGRDGSRVRVTTAGDVVASGEQLRATLCRQIAGLAPVVYLGPADSDDGWATDGVMMAEQLPRGHALDASAGTSGEAAVVRCGRALLRTVAAVQQQGMVLGTIRPESAFIDDGKIVFVARGERLWLMPRPLTTKVAAVAPWPPGYGAPELLLSLPLLDDPPPAADVFSVGVILAEQLLGRFPYPRASYVSLALALRSGEHETLPDSRLGRLLTRTMAPSLDARPSLAELDAELAALATEVGA